MQSISYLKYSATLRLMSRVTLIILLACMPWATSSQAASPPARWAALMHMAAMAGLSFLACVSFKTLWSQVGVVIISGARWLGR